MHLQDASRALADRCDVIGLRRAVGRPDLAQLRTRARNEVGEPESIADLHELTATPHHLAPRRQHCDSQKQCSGPVIDNHDIARPGECCTQRCQDTSSTRGPPTRLEVVLDIDIPRCDEQRLASRIRERRAPEVGVEHRPGGVDDRAQAGHPRRQMLEHMVDELVGSERSTAHSLLRNVHRVTHPRASEPPLRLRKPGVRQHHIGLGHRAAWVGLHAA